MHVGCSGASLQRAFRGAQAPVILGCDSGKRAGQLKISVERGFDGRAGLTWASHGCAAGMCLHLGFVHRVILGRFTMVIYRHAPHYTHASHA